jgi:hypothetical protein
MGSIKDAILTGSLIGLGVGLLYLPGPLVAVVIAATLVVAGGFWLGQTLANLVIAWLDPTDDTVTSDVDA